MNGYYPRQLLNPAMYGTTNMYQNTAFPAGGMVNLDVDLDPGIVSMDVDNVCCPPVQPVHHKHHHRGKRHHDQELTLYVVQKGDSVYKIAKKYGTTMQAIIIANNLANPDLIYPGQTLIIPRA